METRITGVVASAAPRVSVQTAAPAPKPQAAKAEAPRAEAPVDKVTLSTDAKSVVENHGAAVAAAGEKNTPKKSEAAPKKEAKAEAPQVKAPQYAQFNSDLSRSYSVEKNDRIVMRVMQKDDKKVIKEVPARQERHVRDSMVSYIENDGKIVGGDVEPPGK